MSECVVSCHAVDPIQVLFFFTRVHARGMFRWFEVWGKPSTKNFETLSSRSETLQIPAHVAGKKR